MIHELAKSLEYALELEGFTPTMRMKNLDKDLVATTITVNATYAEVLSCVICHSQMFSQDQLEISERPELCIDDRGTVIVIY